MPTLKAFCLLFFYSILSGCAFSWFFESPRQPTIEIAEVPAVSNLKMVPSTLRLTYPSIYSPVFTAINGNESYTYSVLSGPGSVNGASGLFFPDNISSISDTQIQGADSKSNLATASIQGVRNISNGRISTYAEDGTWLYLGGDFTAVHSIEAPHFIALSSAGNPIGCSPMNGFNGVVYTVVSNDDWIFAGGTFTTYRGQSANRIAKISKTSCELDTVFSPSVSNGFGFFVYALALYNDSLFVGGNFTNYKGVADSANRLAKLDIKSGNIDTSFSPPGVSANGFNSVVYALTVANSSLYVGGSFTSYKGVANSANRLAKLDPVTGALDTTFSPAGATSNGFNGNVNAIHAFNSSLYVGGSFTDYRGVANSALRIAKLDENSGVLDTTFTPAGVGNNGFDASVSALAITATDIYVGGFFSAYKGVANSANCLAKLNRSSGVIDTTFSPVGATSNGFYSYFGPGMAYVKSITYFAGSIFVVGNFSDYRGIAYSANSLAKLDPISGNIDTTFSPVGATANGFEYGVSGIAFDTTSIYVTSQSGQYRGTLVPTKIFKLDVNTGALDTTFNPPSATSAQGFNFVGSSLSYFLADTLGIINGKLYVMGGVDSFNDAYGFTYRDKYFHNLIVLSPTKGDIIEW